MWIIKKAKAKSNIIIIEGGRDDSERVSNLDLSEKKIKFRTKEIHQLEGNPK